MGQPVYKVFDDNPAAYDAWYDSAQGRPLYESELHALRPLLADLRRPWLEAGAGTGRFAEALQIDYASDPAAGALHIALSRGVPSVAAWGQQLPFSDNSMGAVLVIYALPFAGDQEGLIRESSRVIASGGHLVLGVVPFESEWGKYYSAKASSKDSFFAGAVFLSIEDVLDMSERAGFYMDDARSTLYQSPQSESFQHEDAKNGVDPVAGFVALRLVKSR